MAWLRVNGVAVMPGRWRGWIWGWVCVLGKMSGWVGGRISSWLWWRYPWKR